MSISRLTRLVGLIVLAIAVLAAPPSWSQSCPDSFCDEPTEDQWNCPDDCPGMCPDLYCNPFWETPASCGEDCPGSCPDTICNAFFEDANNCAEDCPGSCPDFICNPYFEDVNTCAEDCPGSCPDAICNPYFEDVNSCAQDCPGSCPDAICNPFYEDYISCPDDCPPPPVCPNDVCETGETPANCYHDCGTCGDFQCTAPDEDVNNCPMDCPGSCPDAICNPFWEDYISCPDDCDPPPVCPNEVCETGETPETCYDDCGECGDEICTNMWESDVTCYQDCGSCGDLVCTAGHETVESCYQDCGTCGDLLCTAGHETLGSCPQDCSGTCGDLVCNNFFEDPWSCAIDCYVINLSLSGPPGVVEPGMEFWISVSIDGGPLKLGWYNLGIKYPHGYLEVVSAVPGYHPEFQAPFIDDNPGALALRLMDGNNLAEGGTAIGNTQLASVIFRVKPEAPPGLTLKIEIVPDVQLYGLGWEDLSYLLDPWPWPDVTLQTPGWASIQAAPDMDKFLDLDGDYLPEEQDVDLLQDILNGTVKANAAYLLADNARQCDINGNGVADFYDLGRMDAFLRAIRFVNAGTDGVCQTGSTVDDVQEIPVGQGLADANAIEPGANGLLDSQSAGDDTQLGEVIATGPDGLAGSSAIGDDVQIIPLGQGAPKAICLSPGANNLIDSDTSGDDAIVIDPKSLVDMLAFEPQAGVPTTLVPIAPVWDISWTHYLWGVQSTPITVQVVDDNGSPKTGMSPFFRITAGTGYFEGTNYGTTLGRIETDYFGDKEGPVLGQATAVLHPGSGLNRVLVTLEGNPALGIEDASSLAFNLEVFDQDTTQPTSLTIATGATVEVMVGHTIPLTLTLKEGTTALHGLAGELMLLSERNMGVGVDYNFFGEETRVEAVGLEKFESGTLAGWTVAPGGGAIAASEANPGLFGVWSAELVSPGMTPSSLYRTFGTENHEAISVGYQWTYDGDTANPPSLQVFYQVPGDTTWAYLNSHWGGDGLGAWNNERVSLLGCDQIENASIRLGFTIMGGDTAGDDKIYIDNIIVSGAHLLFKETFETYADGAFPPTFQNNLFINAGKNGVLETATGGDDLGLFDFGAGSPYYPYIYPGPNNVLDTLPLDDDTAFAEVIYTGPDGIADTEPQGDDYAELPLGQGMAWAIAIQPGPNQTLESIPEGDDEPIGDGGPTPRVAVDATVFPAGGPSQGADGSQKFLYIGRSAPGPMADYAATIIVDLGEVDQATLEFSSKGPGQRDYSPDGIVPAQRFAVEVSDNGGNNWVPIWDFAGDQETTWTRHKIGLHGDDRFNFVPTLHLRWVMNADEIESSGIDPDGVYIDNVKITGTKTAIDDFGPIFDQNDGLGHYRTTISSMVPGDTVRISAIYRSPYFKSITADDVAVKLEFKKAEPDSIQVIPNNFNLDACKTMDVMVVGRYTDTPTGQVEDMTEYFDLEVHGPARQTAPGQITADCFVADGPQTIELVAIPKIPGLYDPGGTGTGTPTGDVSGKIYVPVTFTGAATSPIWIDLGAGLKRYGRTDGTGNYFLPDVPVGTNYKVSASKQGYMQNDKTISVTAGANTSASIILKSGANFDADAALDSADADDDNDLVLDVNEYNPAAQFNPDYDNDGRPDNVDAFPNNVAEWLDTDGDLIGNNADTDDDNDSLLDTEEVIPGADGFITNPLLADTDGDGRNDNLDCNPLSNNVWQNCAHCHDNDGDLRFELCDAYNAIQGPDCNDASPNAWNTCATCNDDDADARYELCNLYMGIQGPDPCDTNPYAWNTGTCSTCADPDGDSWRGTCDNPAGYNNATNPDCNNADTDNWLNCASCVDADSDTHWIGCNRYVVKLGPDCNDANNNAWTNCTHCHDQDSDLRYELCDAYNGIQGPDCNDANQNAWTNCATCHDTDGDARYELCDAYNAIQGPDCNDANQNAWTNCAHCHDTDADLYYELCDAYVTVLGPDCNDANNLINPGRPEVPCDGLNNDCNAGTLDDADVDLDLLTLCNEIVAGTSDTDPDADDDGVNDYREVVTAPCLDPLDPDSDNDGLCDGNTHVHAGAPIVCNKGEDLDVDGVVDPTETNPCDPDSDHDGLNDGLDIGGCLSALDWDSDNDGIPDGYEQAHVADSPPLNPCSAADAALDPDTDDNPSVHEYWNGSNYQVADPTPDPFASVGCYYWADGDGDGVIGPGDLSVVKQMVAGSAPYDNVLPQGVFDTQDIDKDNVPGPGDISGVKDMLAGVSSPSGYPGMATSIEVFYKPLTAVTVGSTTHVTVRVKNSSTGSYLYSSGFGVVFWVVSGSATIFGGDGKASAEDPSNRYDMSGRGSLGGKATVVIRPNAAGTITLGVKIPACGTQPNGRWCAVLTLSPNITITTQ